MAQFVVKSVCFSRCCHQQATIEDPQTEAIVKGLEDRLSAMGSTAWTGWLAAAKTIPRYNEETFMRSCSPEYWDNCLNYLQGCVSGDNAEEAELITLFITKFQEPGGRYEIARNYQSHLQCKHNQDAAWQSKSEPHLLSANEFHHTCDFAECHSLPLGPEQSTEEHFAPARFYLHWQNGDQHKQDLEHHSERCLGKNFRVRCHVHMALCR